MNPLEYLDALEKVEINKIQEDSKTEYTKDEVMSLIKEMNSKYKKAIFNGEYIFDIETLDKQNVTVDDAEYVVQKLVTHDDKYLLFIQITDVLDKDFGESDIQIMAEEISKAASKSNNIAGVIILPPNMEISLITARLKALYNSDELYFFQEELDFYETFDSITDNVTGISSGKVFKKLMSSLSTVDVDTFSASSIPSKLSYKKSRSTTNSSTILNNYFEQL